MHYYDMNDAAPVQRLDSDITLPNKWPLMWTVALTHHGYSSVDGQGEKKRGGNILLIH
jgi:hypothetical protein